MYMYISPLSLNFALSPCHKSRVYKFHFHQVRNLLSPVGELHHEVEHREKHQEVEEGVAVGHSLFLIIDMRHPPFPLLFPVVVSTGRVVLTLPWKTITAQQRALSPRQQARQGQSKEGGREGRRKRYYGLAKLTKINIVTKQRLLNVTKRRTDGRTPTEWEPEREDSCHTHGMLGKDGAGLPHSPPYCPL